MRRFLMPIALVALVAAACADPGADSAETIATTVPSDNPATTTPAETPAATLQAAADAWSRQSNTYHYTARVETSRHADDTAWVCGETGLVEVQVVDGVVTAARDITGGCDIDLSGETPFPLTVERWLTLVTQHMDVAEFDTNPETGVPTGFFIDTDEFVAVLNVMDFASGERPAATASSRRDDLDEARATWQANRPDAYTMTVHFGCFCPEEARGPFQVTVAGGQTSALFKDEPAGTFAPDHVFTVEGIFDVIEQNLDADAMEIVYDSATGVPVSVSIDVDFQMADEEIYITVDEFDAQS